MGEWIEWKGGECPVQEKDQFEFRYRGGRKVKVQCAGNRYRWDHLGASHDIVAYRITNPDSTPTPP
ncbi:hypothetical protein RJJ65_32245 [Rhizobium hidalgonense]|uniref:Uncharacterized protein n=1 Tax=Rhizobium hidalgonense TaxID=1538159 RepID=A0AAJ2GWJ4_9HYPH|nr:hypothetical protein [Rhizobium hidalgonense]MDR9777230.1 hypothetical protein [Rhizobium hidalgonense]